MNSTLLTTGKRFPTDSVIILGLFLLALAFRVPRLGALDVWFDEVAILFQTKLSFAQVWTFCQQENFPPLYVWGLKVWRIIAPNDTWLRFFSTLIGALVPPAAYVLGLQVKDRRLGLLIAGACLLSLPLIFYSQNIRMYSLYVLTSCLSYIGFLGVLKTNRWSYWILMAVANLAGFYTFLFGLFILMAEILFFVGRNRLNWKLYGRLLASHLPVILLMALWASTLLNRYEQVNDYTPWKMGLGSIWGAWSYLGTGAIFANRIGLATLLNVPFLIGLYNRFSPMEKISNDNRGCVVIFHRRRLCSDNLRGWPECFFRSVFTLSLTAIFRTCPLWLEGIAG